MASARDLIAGVQCEDSCGPSVSVAPTYSAFRTLHSCASKMENRNAHSRAGFLPPYVPPVSHAPTWLPWHILRVTDIPLPYA